MPSELLADVAVRATIPGADAIFTYRVPARLGALARPGQLVWAPLRRQRVQGVILELYRQEEGGGWLLEGDEPPAADRPAPISRLRPDPDAPRSADAPVIRDLVDVADPEAALTSAQIRLARWLSERYRAPLYEALALMLPPGVAQEAEPTWRATPAGMAAELGALPERERAVLYFLRQHGELTERDLRRSLRGGDSELREIYTALQERGLTTRGASISSPRARPRTERLARLLVDRSALDDAIAGLARAPKQRAVLEYLRGATNDEDESVVRGPLSVAEDQRPTTNDQRPKAKEQRTKNNEQWTTGHGLRATDHGPRTTDSKASTPYPVTALYQAAGADLATLRALERRGLLELTTREVRRDPLAGDAAAPDIPPALTAAQERAWQPIAAALDASSEVSVLSSELKEPQLRTQNSKLKTFLLHGVTGSGKTEIYLRAIGRAMRHGRQTLVLVPEIALTAQLVRRFAARFPGRLAVLHSGLALGERYDEWRRLRSGVAMLAIGSRSATFAPLPKLGLIIVDEEHEPSYKHDGAPRYHARDVARRLAELTGSVLILGSATPSVESYAAAQSNEMVLLRLAERVGMARDANGLPRSQPLPLPPVRIVDMRHELQHGNRSIFSRPLQEALAGAIGRAEQAILFLNRRGAAAFVMCRDCGHVIACPNCSSPLVVHYDGEQEQRTKNKERVPAGSTENYPEGTRPRTVEQRTTDEGQFSILVCHSCNHRELAPAHCPDCWSARVKSFGVGTQRVVEEVAALFPNVRTLRWDRDSVGRKGDHERMLDRFLRHEADVLVGTQMIAKGLDLPLVSVVGVVAADTGLHLPDFRAGERTFQLLTQVAGRAGRRSAGAQVVIQTYTPEHYALLAAQEHDYAAFFEQEIAFRRQTGYPPFSRLTRFIYTSGSDERGRRAAEDLAEQIRRLAATLDMGEWGIIGPAPAFFHRQRNRYRWHLLLRAADPAPLLEVLRLPPGWALDVDPVHVL
jgi:primosomal protein N' (replication factor Y) (superfamily II helicase)